MNNVHFFLTRKQWLWNVNGKYLLMKTINYYYYTDHIDFFRFLLQQFKFPFSVCLLFFPLSSWSSSSWKMLAKNYVLMCKFMMIFFLILIFNYNAMLFNNGNNDNDDKIVYCIQCLFRVECACYYIIIVIISLSDSILYITFVHLRVCVSLERNSIKLIQLW